MIDNYAVPWLVAIVMTAVFAWMAHRAARNRALWASAGFFLGLACTTIVLGLSQAAFIPMSYQDAARFSTESVLAALVLNLVVGWLFTTSLHGQHLRLWRCVTRLFTKPAPPH